MVRCLMYNGLGADELQGEDGDVAWGEFEGCLSNTDGASWSEVFHTGCEFDVQCRWVVEVAVLDDQVSGSSVLDQGYDSPFEGWCSLTATHIQ